MNEKFQKPKHKQFKGGKGIASNFAKGFETPKKWYDELSNDLKVFSKVTDTILIELKDEAKKCNDSEVVAYNIRNSKTNSDYQWMKTVMSKGTLSDKVAAYTVLVQDDPVCNLSTIQNMVNLVKVGKKKECLIVMDTLTELFLSDLLIPEKKLKPFHDRPLSKLDELSSGNSGTRKKYLSVWYFEDQLKECYTQFVLALNKAAHDSVESNKEKAISCMYKLLAGNPEQEKNLLSYIINKLGDPSQKVASKAIYCLTQLLRTHPVMKQVVLNEIEKLLFRSNISEKAQYYSICFLAQFFLSDEEQELARNLITVYFSFFKACVKKGDINSRMMSALLTGVNRAYPYAKTEISKLSEHINTMYKVVHVGTFNVSLHTLNLLYQISDANSVNNDRFYTALYKKLLDPNIGTTTHQALFLNLLFRALKTDTKIGRVRAFLKRLLQVALNMQPSMACGILFLVFHMINMKPEFQATIIKSEQFPDDVDDEEHYVDIKTEEEEKDTVEINEEEKDRVEIKEEKEMSNEDKIDTNKITDLTKEKEDVKDDIKHGSSWIHTDIAIKSEFNHPEITNYNPQHRNPLYAGGEFCVYTELLDLQKHFHPTVALFATNILSGENICYSGDPLQDFTLIRFLERFSFKNPKKVADVQKPGVNPIFGKRKLYVPTGVKAHSVISQNYLQINKDKIPVEEMFLYKYLQKKNENKTIQEEDNEESDAESVNDDEFEEMLNKMAGKKKTDDDSDSDLDYMKEIGNSLRNSKDENENEESEEEISDEDDYDDFNELSEEENEIKNENNSGFEETADDLPSDDEDLFDETLEDDDESDIEFNDSDNDEPPTKRNKKNLKKDDINSLFASADEFASILDEEPDFMAGTSHAVSNKDQAHKKQIIWEQKRNNWVKGIGGKSNKRKGRNFDGPKKFNKSNNGKKNKKTSKR